MNGTNRTATFLSRGTNRTATFFSSGTNRTATFFRKEQIELQQLKKKIEVNIITREDSIDFEKFSNKNLKFNYHNILDKKAFEIMLAKSHLFLSFSRADSGPFTLNMCYYLKTFILSFRVGVATELEKKTKSIRVINDFSSENMAKQTLKIMNESTQNIKNILSYKIENLWI